MEFMAGGAMTPEKAQAHEDLARICDGQYGSLADLSRVLAEASDRLAQIAARASSRASGRRDAAAAVRARAAGAAGAALADASGGNWDAVKACEDASKVADGLLRALGAFKESADADAAAASDILYHLTN